ncbi:MAG: hypothetical protein IAE99_10800 [Rhodothermales bacterium]|nr:hypothetical protein [Rhodothermales bacterium]
MSDESPEHRPAPSERLPDPESDGVREAVHFVGGLLLYMPLTIVGAILGVEVWPVLFPSLPPVWFTAAWALIVFALAVGLYRARKPWLAVGLLAGYALGGLLSGGMCIFLPQPL